MKPISTIPATRPAATVHSPNRKDRTRSLARRNVVAGTKETIIGLALTGRDEEEITEILHLSATSIRHLRATDPTFRSRHDEVIASTVAAARGKLVGGLGEAVEAIQGTVKGRQKSPLRFDAAHKVVKGLGVLSGDGREEEHGNGGQVGQGRILIVNIIGNPETRQAAITLARALEGRASGPGSETEPGPMEKV